MSLITSSIKYPVTVVVGVLIALLAGYIAISRVPIQLTPDVERPVITVSTSWFGASPEEIEKEIIEEQEEYLKSVEGLIEMNSESRDGSGTVTLEFASGADLTAAVVRVTNKLNEVPSYPTTADRPVVTSTGSFVNVIAWFIVKSRDSSVYAPHQQILVEDLVKPRLERVEGVAKINVFGGLEEELHVTFEPQLLASTGITIDKLTNVLRSENRDISGGDFSEGKRRYVVRTISRFDSVDDIEQTIITVRDGIPIRVGDVAEVKLAYRKPSALVRHQGESAIAINVQRQLGANVLEVTEGLLAQIELINKEILNPRGLYMENVFVQTDYINSAIDLVFSNIYLGGFLAILVLFLFLRSPSSIMVIGLSIPISTITAFVAMYLFGRTINVISLAGMAFAVGMVVDNSIVVLENIYRHLQQGKNRWKAAADGATEVWGAVLASTVTTVAVFLPIVFVQERAGQLFRDIAIAICSAIVISLIVAMTVIPMLSSRFLKLSKSKDGDGLTPLERFAERIAGFVHYINANRVRRAATLVVVVSLALGLTWTFMPDSEYLPSGNQNFIFGLMLPPPGYNIDEMVKIGESIESQIGYLWEADSVSADTLPGGGLGSFFYVAFGQQAFMGARSRDASRIKELLPIVNGALQSIPGAIGFANQMSLFGGSFAGSRSIEINVTGPELSNVLQIANQAFKKVGSVLPGSRSRPIPGLDLGNPEVRVYPNRARAADVGMSASEIGNAVNTLVDGRIISDYRIEGREIDLVLRANDSWAKHTQDIALLPMATPAGNIITLGDVADIQLRQGPVQINHVERQRAVTILVQLGNETALEEGINNIQEQIVQPMRDDGQLGGLYDIHLAGAADDLSRLRSALIDNFLLAIVLTYLLLAALFQSFAYPVVILFTVPLATFGGVLGLQSVRLFNSSQQLDILTMLGFVILVGTVINNSILIVHYALQRMRDGVDPHVAVRESVKVRVRPIFMSTGTSVLGMLPLIVMPGAGSELYRGLGSVVVGGLALSSVVTLIVTPLMFSFIIELVTRMRLLFGLKETNVAIDSATSGK